MVKSKWLKNMDKKKNSLFLITVHCTINLNFFYVGFCNALVCGKVSLCKITYV